MITPTTRTAPEETAAVACRFLDANRYRRKAGQPTRAEWKRKGTRPALCCVKNGVRLNLEGVAFAGGSWRCGLTVGLNDQWAS